ncbi:MAG: P-loop NTPase [Clostridiaceae bacterium]|nr:P-loop NTPase [Clostridiaceae bacterium]
MAMNIKTLVFTRQKNTKDLLQKYIENIEGFDFLASTDDCDKALNAIGELDKALFIVDVSDYEEEVLNMVVKVLSANPKIDVIALCDKPDSKIVIKAMRVGVNDFLQLPLIKEKFESAVLKIKNNELGVKISNSKCKTLSVFSNKGGVGKTSIAMNLALELAKNTKENVALLDLNFQLGDVTTFWDLTPTFDISYMLKNSDKLNEEFILSTFEKYKKYSLYILANPPYYKSADYVSVGDIEKLISAMQKVFSYIVIDTSTGFGNKVMKVLELSDLIFFVTTVNLPALRNCQKCMELFDDVHIDKDKIKIVINRYMESDDVKTEDVENLLHKKIYWKIPNNYFTMMASINKGVPVADINVSSNVAKSYKDLSMIVADSIYRQNLDDGLNKE